MSYSTPHKVPPPWFRCFGCGRDKAGHDRAEARIPESARHEFVTVTETNRRRAKQAAATQSPQLIPTSEEGF